MSENNNGLLLKTRNLSAYYGEINVLKNINIEIYKGEKIAILGSNGAGKSTLLRCIAGLHRQIEGEIYFGGVELTNKPAFHRIYHGLALVPEEKGLFPEMTVLENLKAGAYSRKSKEDYSQIQQMVFEAFPVLEKRKTQLASTLSGGEQQMLAIGRTLIAGPRLLMLDEPSMGLAPILVQKVFDVVKEIGNKGVDILLVEQNVYQSLEIADRAYVLENGEITLEGPASELLESEKIKKAYLGI